MSLYSPTILKFESIPNPIWCHSNTTKILLALISFATNILFQQISHVRRNLSTIALFIADIYYSRVRLVGYRICVRIMHEYSLSLCVGHHRQDVCVFIRNTNSDCFLVLSFFRNKKKTLLHCIEPWSGIWFLWPTRATVQNRSRLSAARFLHERTILYIHSLKLDDAYMRIISMATRSNVRPKAEYMHRTSKK